MDKTVKPDNPAATPDPAHGARCGRSESRPSSRPHLRAPDPDATTTPVPKVRMEAARSTSSASTSTVRGRTPEVTGHGATNEQMRRTRNGVILRRRRQQPPHDRFVGLVRHVAVLDTVPELHRRRHPPESVGLERESTYPGAATTAALNASIVHPDCLGNRSPTEAPSTAPHANSRLRGRSAWQVGQVRARRSIDTSAS